MRQVLTVRVFTRAAILPFFLVGCASLRPGPVSTPPVPTPMPTAIPIPSPSPVSCTKISGETSCSETGPVYVSDVVPVVAGILEVEQGSQKRFTVGQQKAATIKIMKALEAKGYCTSYDLDAGNSGMASEMGIRERAVPRFTEWLQIFASEGYVRWFGMYRSTCIPATDEEQISEVEARWAKVHCPLDPSREIRIKVDIGRGAAGAVWLDATYEYFYGVNEDGTNAGPCGDPRTGAPRRWCSLGVDGGPFGVICQDELVGNPIFQSLSSSLSLAPGFRDNENFAQVFGNGQARVCSSLRPELCTEIEIP